MASWLQSQANARYPRDSQASQQLEPEENRTPPSARRSGAALRASEAAMFNYFPEASPTARSDRAFRCGGLQWAQAGGGAAARAAGRRRRQAAA